MNAAQIIELFVKAAEVDQKLPDTARPAKAKAINYGYVHDTADINGWSAEDKHANNWAWLDPKNLRNTTNDMGIWEVALEVMKLVPCENKRRSLWAWAKAEAGGQSFSKWCKNVEGISRQLGDWRKKSAISHIELAFLRKPLLHNENVESGGFTTEPEISDKTSNIAVWRPEESKPLRCFFDTDLDGFDWADKRNAMRRQRDARKRQQEAA